MSDPFARFRMPWSCGDILLESARDMAWRGAGHSKGFWQYESWPTSRRRRLPIGLHRDPLRNWTVSDEVMARGEASWLDLVGFGTKLEVNPRLHAEAVLVRARDEYDDIAELMLASWKAAQDTAYRLRRDYAKAGRKS